MVSLPWLPLALLPALAALVACTGSHNDLGQTDASSSGTGGASGGSPPVGAGGQGGGPTPVEPDLPPALTVVNAIVDRPELSLCFLRSPSDASDPATPWPSGSLPYASAQPIELPGSIVPSQTEVEILVLTGGLGGVDGESCRAIADDPASFPQLELLSLGLAPADTFTKGRHLLLAVTGCFGGLSHDGEALEDICGASYSPTSPTPSVVFAPLSRLTDPSAVGLQLVNATGAGRSLDFFLTPSLAGALELSIVTGVVPGAASPFPPSNLLSSVELVGPSAAGLRATVSAVASLSHESLLGDAMTGGDVDATAFSNGKNVAIVAVGPSPGSASGAWWNPFAFVAVAATP